MSVCFGMKRLTFMLLGLVCSIEIQAQLLVDRITIACGNNYFAEDENYNNPALVVRGIFCGDAYFWTPISEGDVLSELAYLDDEPFTGTCIDLDSNGLLLARYTFQDGLIQRLEEYHDNGSPYKIFNYAAGVPQGSASRFEPNGLLDSHFYFENGQRSGFYYITRDRTDWGLPPCIELGKTTNGESIALSKPCFSEGD